MAGSRGVLKSDLLSGFKIGEVLPARKGCARSERRVLISGDSIWAKDSLFRADIPVDYFP